MARARNIPSAHRTQTIYMQDGTREALDPIGGNLSNRLCAVSKRYAEMVRMSMPTLAEAEWLAIIDATQSHPSMIDPAAGPAIIWQVVLERAESLGDRWQIRADSLAHRLREMPYPARVAVVEVVHRFQHTAQPHADAADILVEAGARIAGPVRR